MSSSQEKGHQASELPWVDPGATRLALKFNGIGAGLFNAKIHSILANRTQLFERDRELSAM